MPKKPLEAIEEYFSQVTEPGVDRTKEHKLVDMIAIAICGVICGAEGWTDNENFGKSKLSWLKTFLELPNGIPSHDTFGRVFSLIDAEEFQRAFFEMERKPKRWAFISPAWRAMRNAFCTLCANTGPLKMNCIAKQLQVAWDQDYLLKVLAAGN